MTALRGLLLGGVILGGLTGCEDKEAQAEIEKLKDEVAVLAQDYEQERQRANEFREKMDEAQREANKLKMELRGLEGKLQIAEREVERTRQREEARVATTSGRGPSRKEREAAGREAAEAHLGALVTIKGDATTGSGFLVESDEKTWIYCSPSTLSGNTKLEITGRDGGKLEKFGAFQMASGAPLVRLEVLDEVETKLTVGETPEMRSGSPILGINKDGALASGRSYGSEGSILKADSRFTDCPVGNPVFHGETGALLGIMVEGETAERELWPMDTSYSYGPRQAVSRLDREIEWQDGSIGGFLDEAKALADADKITRLVMAFTVVRLDSNGANFDVGVGGTMTAKEIFAEHKDLSAVRSLVEAGEWFRERAERASDQDKNKKLRSVYGDIMRASKRSTSQLEGKTFSAYHAKMAEQSIGWRKEAEKKLAAILANLED